MKGCVMLFIRNNCCKFCASYGFCCSLFKTSICGACCCIIHKYMLYLCSVYIFRFQFSLKRLKMFPITLIIQKNINNQFSRIIIILPNWLKLTAAVKSHLRDHKTILSRVLNISIFQNTIIKP